MVLSTRVSRPNLENELALDPKAQAPVTSALTSAYEVLTTTGEHDNRFYTVVLWHWCYMHLLCDVRRVIFSASMQARVSCPCRMIELACGREGPVIATKASQRAGPWATSIAARRSVLHCISILQLARSAPMGSEVPPHLYVYVLRHVSRFLLFTKNVLALCSKRG